MSKRTYDFNKENEISRESYPLSIKHMNKYFNSEFKECGKDRDILGADISDENIDIDIKYNHRYYNWNFIIEWQVIGDNGYTKIGNTIDPDKTTDYLLWITLNATYLINYKTIREVVIKNQDKIKSKFGLCDAWNDGYRAILTKVPMHYIQKHIVAEIPFVVGDCRPAQKSWEEECEELLGF